MSTAQRGRLRPARLKAIETNSFRATLEDNEAMDENLEEGLLEFLWRHKIWWLVPAVTVLGLTAALLWAAPDEGASPFVYTLF